MFIAGSWPGWYLSVAADLPAHGWPQKGHVKFAEHSARLHHFPQTLGTNNLSGAECEGI